MKLTDKKRFIRNLCGSIRDEALGKAAQMPDDWDGIELRIYLAEKFNAEKFQTHRARMRDYNNAIATTTL